MPAFKLAETDTLNWRSEVSFPQLKPLRFAHAFEVALNTENSGEWFEAENGWLLWQLTIRSPGAKSLNLIFNSFDLPPETRLFVFNGSGILGAFTESNNKPGGKFAITPLAGDEIVVQFEQKNVKRKNPFSIVKVNHDYLGIIEKSERRPMGRLAGACNIDVKCPLGEAWQKVKNSVCRLIVDGNELCTGVLLNNTAENQKPYVLSASHCYDHEVYAETTVYSFNYESPFCAPLDGDPSNTISGAVMKAQFDSLDFALTQLSVVPPPEFRPYFAGWDRTSGMPSSTVTIHHPAGDIKKLAVDEDTPEIVSFPGAYVENAFFEIGRWEAGVTEAGSSGGPLFNSEQNMVAILTGGYADCDNPELDYFSRLALSWDYKSDSSMQLKHWLDPLNTNVTKLAGKQFNTEDNLCRAFTNLNESDGYELVQLMEGNSFSGYWGGSNSAGITEIMERFTISGNEKLAGVSFGVGMVKSNPLDGPSEITLKVYNGNSEPEELIYSQTMAIGDMVEDAMNYIAFSDEVAPADTFFVGFELSGMQPADSFAVYQSVRPDYTTNACWIRLDGNWKSFTDASDTNTGLTNIFELVACNLDDFSADTQQVNNNELLLYPNPVSSSFTLITGQAITQNSVFMYDLLGRQVKFTMHKINSQKAVINLSGNISGVYFLQFRHKKGTVTKKISYVPQ